MTPTSSRRATVRTVVSLLAGVAVTAIAITEVGLFALRPENGPLAVIDILTPHLAIGGLLLVPLVLLRRWRTTWASASVLVLTAALRFGSNWLSLPVTTATGEADRIEVATWNLEVFARPGSNSAALVRGTTADVIALQELQPDAASAISADPMLRERFPYRAFSPRADVLGLGILSRYPIVGDTVRLDPAVQTARLLLPSGQSVKVLNVHPLHGSIAVVDGIPIGLDVTRRNEHLDAIRSRVASLVADGAPVILLGDLNTADSEPALARFLEGGLRDAHAEVGFGPGWTWRPRKFEFLGIGLVRIDHIIVSPLIQPLSIGEVCPEVGDHCLVHARLAMADASAR